jgi:hypothetical protein
MTGIGRLPRRFPVGTRYVLEGLPAGQGQVRVISRVLVLPNGQQFDLTQASAEPAAHRRARRANARRRNQR